MSIRRTLLGWLALASIGAMYPTFTAAQQQLGAIQGTIVDESRAVIPGVTVTVTNLETGVVRTAVTNQTGVYRVTSLDPGRYRVAAELSGFRTAQQNEVVLPVGATLGVNFTLTPGTLEEAIEVRAVAPTIQTEKADVSGVVEQKQINDLPLVGRNVLALAALQPGIGGVGTRADFLSPEQGMGVTASGVRASGNNASIDGASIDGGPWGGTILVVPNVEAVQEYQVIANNPSAEFGRNSGATVQVITKGGSNTLSGSAFQFHRNQNLRARGFFENRNAPKADFRRNDFGGSLGGPIKRDQAFFFFSTEIVREVTGNSFNQVVETQQLVDWVNATRPNSIAAQLFRMFPPVSYPTSGLVDLGAPLPGVNTWSNTPDGIPDVGTIPVTISGPRDGEQLNFRYDHVLRGGQDRFRATYYLTNIETWNLYPRPQFDKPFPFRNQMFSLAHTWVISGDTLNEATFGLGRQHGEAGNPSPESPDIGITGGVARFGTEFWHPIDFTQNNFNFKNTLTMNRGRHSFRTGGELRLGRDGATLTHWRRPTYNFQSILDFIDDEPFNETRAVDPATGLATAAPGKYLTNEWALFIQDNWKMRPNVTLNLGLRYDNFGNPSKADGSFNGILLGPGSTRQEQIANARVGTVDRLYATDWNNFGPRLGATWDPTATGRFVVRAGFGKTYNRMNNTVFSDERLNPPQFAQAVGSVQDGTPIVYTLGPDFTPNPALGRGLDPNGGIIGARVALRVVDPELQIPEYYNWFSGVQYQLPWNFVAEANYNGTAGRKLLLADGPTSINWNRFSGDLLDGRLDRLNPSFASVDFNETRGYSNYHGASFQILRRYAQGFSFQAAYTLGRWKDVPANPVEVTDLDADYGFSDSGSPITGDVRHKLAMNFVAEVPYRPAHPVLNAVLGGWQVNAISIMQTGLPFSVTCTQAWPNCDFNADGVTNDRVNMTPGATNIGNPSRQQWLDGVLNAADFSNPAPFTQSNQPRNAFRGPGLKNVDLSLFKNFGLPGVSARASTVQIRLEMFNAFNWVNFFNPVGIINNVNFGRVTGARGNNDVGGPRVIQLGAKWMF